MKTVLLFSLLPGLLWKQDAGSVEELKRLQSVRVFTSDDAVAGYERVPPPKSQMRMSSASATTVPWVDANGWRYMRGLAKAFYPSVPAGSGALAMAEAFAYGADAIVEPAPADLPAIKNMADFFRKVDASRLPILANIGVVDDGSPQLGEVLNLLGRRNLLYRVVLKEDPSLDINIRVGTKQYPRESTTNPNDFAARVREKLTDEKRLLRVYGTYTVIGNLTGDKTRARLHLLNYSPRPAKDVRIRVLGVYETVKLADSTDPSLHAKDVAIQDGGTEFTVASLQTYAVVDLEKKR